MAGPLCALMNSVYLVLGILIALSGIHVSLQGSVHTAAIKSIRNQLKRSDYDSGQHPGLHLGTYTMITVDIFINTLSEVNEMHFDYKLNIFLRQNWRDSRLRDLTRNVSVTLDSTFVKHIWTPDLFFSNEKDSKKHSVTKANVAFDIDPEGHVYYTQRLTLVLDCPMHLHKFPLDSQDCKLRIESFAYSTRDIQFRWNPEAGAKAVELSDDIRLPEFYHDKLALLAAGNVTYPPNPAKFNYLTATFHLTRMLNYYMIGTFIPSLLIVTLSWLSFMIDASSAPARVSISLLAVLTMTTQFSGIRGQLPKVAYIKAIDVWMTGCLSFVFLALMEFAVVNTLHRKQRTMNIRRKAEMSQSLNANSKLLNCNGNGYNNNGNSAASTHPDAKEELLRKSKQYNSYAEFIELSIRILYPIAFIIFIIIWVCVFSP